MGEPQHRTAIITDSTSDVPAEMIAHYGLLVAPQYVIWGTEEFLDRVTITPQAFYERLAKDPIHPKTSQPTAKDFIKLIDQAKAAGAQEAIAITISHQLSGTVQSASQAAQEVDLPLHVVDSLSVSMGLGWQVIAAARAREAGGDAAAIMAATEAVRKTLQVMFVVDTLEYLHKGGRIGGAARLVGTALQLKPALYVDHTTGRIEPGERTRTMKKAVEKMVETVFEKLGGGKLHVAVQHVAAQAEAEALAARIRDEYNPVEMVIGDASIAIGVHAGPGTFGICAYREI